MAIDDTPTPFFAPWPERLRHSALILLAAGVALTVLVSLGELPLLPAAAVFALMAAAALVPWRRDPATSSDDVRTADPVEAAAVNGGERRHILSAYSTFVAMDPDGKPRPVPPLTPITPDEVRRYGEAQLRRELRLKHAHEMAQFRAKSSGA